MKGCPVTPLLPSLAGISRSRATLGWMASTSVAALLISGIAALAMSIQPAGESMGEEAQPLIVMLPPAPAVEAMTEPAPEVAEEVPEEQAEAPVEEATPDAPEVTEAPDVPDTPEMVEDTPPDDTPVVDNEPPPPAPVAEAVVKPKPKPERKEEPKKKPEKKEVKKTAEKKPEEKKKVEKKKTSATASASAAAPTKKSAGAASAGAGKVSAASYGAQVLKKANRTKKKRTSEKGRAVVGFSITDSGGVGTVKIVSSSGSADIDQIAMDHIRRSAPFPPPPAGVGRNYSFEFVAGR